MGSQALTVMVAEILTTVFFIFYLSREIKAMRKEKKDYLKVGQCTPTLNISPSEM